MNLRHKLFCAIACFVVGVSAVSGVSYLNETQPPPNEIPFEQALARVKSSEAKRINVKTGAGSNGVERSASTPISFHLFRILFILFLISPPIIVVLLLIIIKKMDERK